MNIKPMNDMICVEPSENDTTTASGIVLPSAANDKPIRGTVVAVGPGKVNNNGTQKPIRVNVGDTVLYVKEAGVPFKVDEGKEVLFLKEEHIVAVVN